MCGANKEQARNLAATAATAAAMPQLRSDNFSGNCVQPEQNDENDEELRTPLR